MCESCGRYILDIIHTAAGEKEFVKSCQQGRKMDGKRKKLAKSVKKIGRMVMILYLCVL